MDNVLLAVVSVELLAIGGLLLMLRLGSAASRRRTEEVAAEAAFSIQQCREALAAYKLDVAKTYATVGLIKDVERRLTEHLVRIEVKLDNPLHVVRQGGV